MRLAFFNATRKWGGVKTWTLEFAAALTRLGHTVIVLGREGAFIERALGLGLDARAVDFGPDYNPIAIARFMHFFRTERIDAALVNVGRDLRTAGIAAKLSGIPLVQRVGLPEDMKNVWKVRALHNWIRPHYLCPCHFNRNGLLAHLPCIDAADTTVIHSAKIPAKTAPAHVGSPLQLATTSQLNRDKGHEELMRVLARLRDEGHAFHWHVAGTGHEEAALHTLADELRLQEHITWHGWTQNVGAILQQADVFALPSLSEGLPNTLLEAMAAGCIPVARNVGGVAEVWPDSLKDFLITPGEHSNESFHASLSSLLTAQADTLLRWKHAAWSQCVQAFSLDTQARKLEAFFTDITGKR
ncbi:glycosyltransferase [Desulfovibrio mangrovi]|uniref:glycosyltransferase n=1 Tax=Desulfovibrio mangrovi TaxID=2976983 RepID=UPI002245B831|nr:glycosyltransferase [Desulfovibrio mangrovi]UZP68879.1 glycosyltransferase [Desulfovibrio mangrovi]